MIFLYAYDVADQRRRNRISKKLEQFGIRMQKSLFQCDVTPDMAQNIKASLLRFINQKEDSLLLYSVCERDSQKAEGFGILPMQPDQAACYEIL
jgi:CRISPR-associated protein Cas2